jgi:hypothetical protein
MICNLYLTKSLEDFMIFKEYGEIFGKPGESVHKLRMFGTQTAAFDFILTIIFAWIFSALTQIPLVLVTIALLSASVAVHYLFGVQTHDVKWLMMIATEVLRAVLKPTCDANK